MEFDGSGDRFSQKDVRPDRAKKPARSAAREMLNECRNVGLIER